MAGPRIFMNVSTLFLPPIEPLEVFEAPAPHDPYAYTDVLTLAEQNSIRQRGVPEWVYRLEVKIARHASDPICAPLKGKSWVDPSTDDWCIGGSRFTREQSIEWGSYFKYLVEVACSAWGVQTATYPVPGCSGCNRVNCQKCNPSVYGVYSTFNPGSALTAQSLQNAINLLAQYGGMDS